MRNYSLYLFIFLASNLNAGETIQFYQIEKENLPSQNTTTASKNLSKDTHIYWQAPYSWQVQSLGSLRKGSWLCVQDEKKLDISILSFPGEVGGLLANINRWAEQIELAGINEEQAQSICQNILVGGHEGYYITLKNNNNKKGIIGVILPMGKDSWFFKMMGDETLLESEESNFKAFLNTVQFE